MFNQDFDVARLKALVREMGEILKLALPLSLEASDWAIRYGLVAFNERALALNDMFFVNDDEGILNRPEIKEIMEGK